MPTLRAMASMSNSPVEQLWKEYGQVFQECDDLTLARWMSQTLGQIQGRVCRLSHPLLGTYRLAAQLAYERQTWLKRLANPPGCYPESSCCRAPLLPLLTRDVLESGLVCQHCGSSAVPFDEIPEEIRGAIKAWGEEYAPIHAVAHWDERQKSGVADYNKAYDNAAAEARRLLLHMSQEIVPKLLEYYPAIVWEDQDECLEVRPEDIVP